MPYFRTSGGSFLEIDLPDPRNTHAVERFAQQIEQGDLAEVPADSVEWVESEGAKKLGAKAPAEPVAEAPRRARAPKSEAPATEE